MGMQNSHFLLVLSSPIPVIIFFRDIFINTFIYLYITCLIDDIYICGN